MVTRASEKFLKHRFGNFYMRTAHRDDNVKISCQTNDPSATVNLTTENELGKRLIKNGQTFTIRNIELSDNKAYTCVANNGSQRITLLLGSMLIKKGKLPLKCLFFVSLKYFSLTTLKMFLHIFQDICCRFVPNFNWLSIF